jgi:hypothetical protein
MNMGIAQEKLMGIIVIEELVFSYYEIYKKLN